MATEMHRPWSGRRSPNGWTSKRQEVLAPSSGQEKQQVTCECIDLFEEALFGLARRLGDVHLHLALCAPWRGTRGDAAAPNDVMGRPKPGALGNDPAPNASTENMRMSGRAADRIRARRSLGPTSRGTFRSRPPAPALPHALLEMPTDRANLLADSASEAASINSPHVRKASEVSSIRTSMQRSRLGRVGGPKSDTNMPRKSLLRLKLCRGCRCWRPRVGPAGSLGTSNIGNTGAEERGSSSKPKPWSPPLGRILGPATDNPHVKFL